VVEKLGFRPLSAEPALIDGVDYASVVLDFGPGSVDGWLSALTATELGVAGNERMLDNDTHELVIGSRRVPLSPREFGVLGHLVARTGKTVSRYELLSDVWATEYAGGSNVVDVVVRSLRAKLADGAHHLQTVRGCGYRLAPNWYLL